MFFGVPTEGSFLIVTCTAEVPERENFAILIEGDGLMDDTFSETAPGTFVNTRIFNSPIDASITGIYRCTLLVNNAVIDSANFSIDVASMF